MRVALARALLMQVPSHRMFMFVSADGARERVRRGAKEWRIRIGALTSAARGAAGAAAARRADESPRHGVVRVAREAPRRVPRHPRPRLPLRGAPPPTCPAARRREARGGVGCRESRRQGELAVTDIRTSRRAGYSGYSRRAGY